MRHTEQLRELNLFNNCNGNRLEYGKYEQNLTESSSTYARIQEMAIVNVDTMRMQNLLTLSRTVDRIRNLLNYSVFDASTSGFVAVHSNPWHVDRKILTL